MSQFALIERKSGIFYFPASSEDKSRFFEHYREKDFYRSGSVSYTHLMFAEKQGADLVEKVTSKAMGLKRLCAYYGCLLYTSRCV